MEQEKLKKNQKEIEKGWSKFAETIKQTQRDLLLMEKIKKIENTSVDIHEQDEILNHIKK